MPNTNISSVLYHPWPQPWWIRHSLAD